MTHSPNAIAALARAAIPAERTMDAALTACLNMPRFQQACTPAIVLALCERLRFYTACIDPSAEDQAMTTPLTPEPGLPGGAARE